MTTNSNLSPATKSEAIAMADACLSNARLPTYSEMFKALEDLHANCWLDADPAETEDLGAAKERARNACGALKI